MLLSKKYLLLLVLPYVCGQYYDSFTGRKINRTRFEEMNRIGLVPVCAMRIAPCDKDAPRRMDMSCNNLRYPTRGTSFTPFTRMLTPMFSEGGGLRRSRSGRPLPLARSVRVALMTDGRRKHKAFTDLVPNYAVFIAGDVTSVHDTVNYVAYTRTCCEPSGRQNPMCMPVLVQDDDLHLRRSNVRCMNLTRAVTYQRLGCVPSTVPLERINIAAPMLELSGVYGHDERGARRGREFTGGRLRAESIGGKDWPLTGGVVCVNNVPPAETRCHDAPSPGANSLLGINLVFMWFYRSHNAIADSLRHINPCWDDNKLYYTAREINIAYFIQILYYELLPELMGRDFLVHNKVLYETPGHVDDYAPSLEPRVTIEFATAIRFFHTLQDGTLNLYKPDGRLYGSVQVVDFILRTGALPLNGLIGGMTQGSFRQGAGAMDDIVDPDIGERVLGRLQFASDVISSDIMKGRDFGLPPYNQYRKACGLPPANKFKDLLGWMDRKAVEALSLFYEHPDDIDLMVAMLAEHAMPGAQIGPTLACIMVEQLVRWRRADRFWYEHPDKPGAFTLAQLGEIRKMTMAKFLCQHGDTVSAIQPKAFLIPGHGNEITKCKEYVMPDLTAFRDDRCYPSPTKHENIHTPRREQKNQNPQSRNQKPPVSQHQNPFTSYPTQHFDKNVHLLASYPAPNPITQDYVKDIISFVKNSFITNEDNKEPLLTTQSNQPILTKDDYSNQEKLLNLNIDIRNKNTQNPNYKTLPITRVNPTNSRDQNPSIYAQFANQDNTNPKPSTNWYPNVNPDVKIYPNADPVDPNYNENVDPTVEIPKDKNQNGELHPSVRNKDHPFEEFMQNYWQSTTANPFKAFLS